MGNIIDQTNVHDHDHVQRDYQRKPYLCVQAIERGACLCHKELAVLVDDAHRLEKD